MNGPSRPFVPLDERAIARHLEVIYGYLDGFAPIRMFSEKGTPSKRARLPFLPIGPGLAPAVRRLAQDAAGSGHGVYVVPGAVAGPGKAGSADVVASGVLLVDLDVGDIAGKRAHLERHLGPPTLVIASGGTTEAGEERLHLYWGLTEAVAGDDLKLLTRLRAIVAQRSGGDVSFASIHQPIRLAGTVHGKHGVKRLVRILEDIGIEYDLADLAERVEALPPVAGLTSEPTAATDALDRERPTIDRLMTSRIRADAQDPETRYSALCRVIGHWLRQVRHQRVTLADAWEAVQDHNAAQIAPPWPVEQLRREFDALLRVDSARHGPMTLTDSGIAPPALSEDALTAAFVAGHAAHWRRVAVWGAWMRWTGARWERDDTHAVLEAIRQVARNAIPPDARPSEARRIASERTIRAVERIAAADPALAARVEDWDRNPFLFNTPAAIVDLESGELIPHDPNRMLTQIAGASPGPASLRWQGFIDEVTGGDSELASYLARLCGYCLSGSIEEHVFVFLHGAGANGKSVFLQAISQVMGSYAATAPLGAFMASRSDAHPTDLAGLAGKRLVTVTETEAGRAWAESRIKAITGGDPIRARFMNRDFFEFMPTFKLIITGNHRPRLTGVGQAMRRRLHLVPFAVTIPPERRDRRLLDRLLEERDGILGWMIDGHAAWRELGLAPPQSVLQSAEDYFADEDVVAQWIEERCETGGGRHDTAGRLFADWSDWARSSGFDFGSRKTLGDALRERGFVNGKVGGQRVWRGLSLRRRDLRKGDAA